MNDTLRDSDLARDLSWTAALAAHSGGIAKMWLDLDCDGERVMVQYGLIWAGDGGEESS